MLAPDSARSWLDVVRAAPFCRMQMLHDLFRGTRVVSKCAALLTISIGAELLDNDAMSLGAK